MKLIPAVDLYEGQCVRLYQGDFSRKTDYAPGPAELLHRYAQAGAEWVHVVDLSGAQVGRPQHLGLIERLAGSSGSKLQVGGGIRSGTTISDLLHAGVSRVVIGSAAVQAPKDVYAWLERFGVDRIVLAFDVRVGLDDHPRVYTHGWARTDALILWRALAPYSALSCDVLCTDISRDGTLGVLTLSSTGKRWNAFPNLPGRPLAVSAAARISKRSQPRGSLRR